MRGLRTWGVIVVLAAIAAAGSGPRGAADDPDDVRSLEEVTRRIEADPENADLWADRADLHRRHSRWSEMERDAERALELDAHNARAYGLRGLARGVGEKFDDALEDLDRAIAIDPSESLFWGLRGNTLLHMGKCVEALPSFDRAIALRPEAASHFDRGACRRETGDLRGAVDDYTAALALDPDHAGASGERGFAHLRLGNFALALEDLERCRERFKDDPQLAVAVAWILATCPDATIRDGRRALAIAGETCDPITCDVSAPLNVLAAARAELGEYDEAETLLRRAVALSPFDEGLRAASMRRLEAVRNRQPIRDASTPPALFPRFELVVPRDVAADDFLAAPPDVVALDLLNTLTILQTCPIARAGATIHAAIDGLPLKIESANVERVERRLEDRRRICSEAIAARGSVRLAPGYAASVAGDCDAWGLADGQVLVEQEGALAFLTQGVVRHMAVVVESAVAVRHDMNTDVRLVGALSDGRLVFTTPMRGGVTVPARDRCRWTLEPRAVEGEEWADAYAGRALAHRSYGDFHKAVDDLETAWRFRRDPEIASLEAFLLATCDDDSARDGPRAVEVAKRARAVAGPEPGPRVLMALAAAHAEAGDFVEAVAWQERVVEIVEEEEKPEQEDRLRDYREGRPCRIRRGP